eukprot:EG_transcript_6270
MARCRKRCRSACATRQKRGRPKADPLQFPVPPHPYGVQPGGNALLVTDCRLSRDPGLGTLRALPDPLLADLFGSLQAGELLACAAVSQAFYVLAHQDDLWRALVLDAFRGDFQFVRGWKETYLQRWARGRVTASGPLHTPLHVRHFFSDALYQPWLCAAGTMREEWLAVDNIDRRAGLTLEEFIEQYDMPNKPVMITDVVSQWPAMKKWTREHLLALCGDTRFRCGPVDMRLRDYLQYSSNCKEERPLYLFDCKFAENVPELADDYSVPAYFEEDLFKVLGPSRPDYRWLIIGPAGSGSSFHVDPNATNAWNGLVTGAKRWLLFPPHRTPPGIFATADMGEVTAPQSMYEWFMNYYQWVESCAECVQCTARAGELVFVPRGWWHAVVNLEESIAITQNFVNARNLPHVLQFLREKSDQVSGVCDERMATLFGEFRAALEEQSPELLRFAEMASSCLASPQAARGTAWAKAAAEAEEFVL